ncbi:MAG: type II toxin-antitoxin system VapC family toxin [Pseudomonadota bacterium]
MKSAVLDTSGFIPLVIQTPRTDAIRTLAETYGFIAPDLIVAETLNAVRRLVRAGKFEKAHVENAMNILAAIVDFRPLAPLAKAVPPLMETLDHSAYDCFFAALALSEGVPLVSGDSVFNRKAAERLPVLPIVDLNQATPTP